MDRLWEALSQGGHDRTVRWLKDRYGVPWQIVPTVLGEMMKDSNRARAKRVAEVILKMVKIDTAVLKKPMTAAAVGNRDEPQSSLCAAA